MPYKNKMTALGLEPSQLNKRLQGLIKNYAEAESTVTILEQKLTDTGLSEKKRGEITQDLAELKGVIRDLDAKLETDIETWFNNKDKNAAIAEKMKAGRDKKKGGGTVPPAPVNEPAPDPTKTEPPKPDDKKEDDIFGTLLFIGVVVLTGGLALKYWKR